MYIYNLIKSNIKIIILVMCLSMLGYYVYKYRHNISEISILQDTLEKSRTNNKVLNDSININKKVSDINDDLEDNITKRLNVINSKISESISKLNTKSDPYINIKTINDVYKEVKWNI